MSNVIFSRIGTSNVKITNYTSTPVYFQVNDFERVTFDETEPNIVVVQFRQTEFRVANAGANVDDPTTESYNAATGTTVYSKAKEVASVGSVSSFTNAENLADEIVKFFENIVSLAVRNDQLTPLSEDQNYTPICTDSRGRLLTSISNIGVDAGGRLQVNNNVLLGNYRFIHDITSNNVSDRMDTAVSGGGVKAHNSTSNSLRLSTNGVTVGHAILQTRQSHPYFNGQSQSVEFTMFNFNTSSSNITKRIGYYSFYSLTNPTPSSTTKDGIYLESTNGVVTFYIVNRGTTIHSAAQSAWNGDKMDGTGPSGVTIDWSKFQVLLWDFLYLGGAVIKFYIFQGGQAYLVHSYAHTNASGANGQITFIGSPNQPFTADISNTTSAVADVFDICCAQISTSNQISSYSGKLRTISKYSPTNNINSVGNYLLLGIRLTNDDINSRYTSIKITDISVSSGGSNAIYIVMLLYNPSVSILSGATWTTHYDGGTVGEYDIEYIRLNEGALNDTFTYASSNADNHRVLFTSAVTGQNTLSFNSETLPRLGAPIDLSGTFDTVYLGVRVLGNSGSFIASLSWVEEH